MRVDLHFHGTAPMTDPGSGPPDLPDRGAEVVLFPEQLHELATDVLPRAGVTAVMA